MRALLSMLLGGCGGHGLYAPCGGPEDCPAPQDVEAECLDKSGEGFCTWACAVDDDCAFDEDEWSRVCASFESEPGTHCFPACRDDKDDGPVCPDRFGCRSTGGGSDNRKVCFPTDSTAGDSPGNTPQM